jgi:hypothetical protein
MSIHKGSAFVCVLALGVGALCGSANAAPVDPGRVQTLAGQIENALVQLGCGATAQAEVAQIQSTIATSGADPFVARAALRVVQSYSGLCGSDAAAVASVDQTISQALEGSTIPQAGGPGGGSPIGSPPAFVSGGGSDYLTR